MSGLSFESWRVNLQDFVTSLSFSSDGSILAVALSGGDLALIDVASGQIVDRMQAHAQACSIVAWNPKQPQIATGGHDGTVRIWNINPLAQSFEMAAGSAWVEQLKWSPAGTELAVGAGRHLSLLGASGNQLWRFSDHESAITALEWNIEHNAFASACYKAVRVFQNSPEPHPIPLPALSSLVSLAWSPNSRFMCAGTQDASVVIWPIPYTMGAEMGMSGFQMKVKHMSWKSDGSALATASGQLLLIWDTQGRGPAGKKPIELDFHEGIVTALKYSPHDPDYLVSGDEEGLVVLWSPQKTKYGYPLAQLSGEVSALEWSSSVRCMAVASGSGEIILIGKSEDVV